MKFSRWIYHSHFGKKIGRNAKNWKMTSSTPFLYFTDNMNSNFGINTPYSVLGMVKISINIIHWVALYIVWHFWWSQKVTSQWIRIKMLMGITVYNITGTIMEGGNGNQGSYFPGNVAIWRDMLSFQKWHKKICGEFYHLPYITLFSFYLD